MEAKKETTDFFVKKTGDKILVELEVSGDPDKAVSELIRSLTKEEDLVDNLRVNLIYFKGKSIDDFVDDIVNDVTNKISSNIEDAFNKIKSLRDNPIKKVTKQ